MERTAYAELKYFNHEKTVQQIPEFTGQRHEEYCSISDGDNNVHLRDHHFIKE